MDISNLPSTMALAFLGDAVYSYYVRRHLVELGESKSKTLNVDAQEYVTAKKQYENFEKIKNELTDDEMIVFKKAFNSAHLNRPKHTSILEYRTATGLEALLGMLDYMGEKKRLEYLIELLIKNA